MNSEMDDAARKMGTAAKSALSRAHNSVRALGPDLEKRKSLIKKIAIAGGGILAFIIIVSVLFGDAKLACDDAGVRKEVIFLVKRTLKNMTNFGALAGASSREVVKVQEMVEKAGMSLDKIVEYDRIKNACRCGGELTINSDRKKTLRVDYEISRKDGDILVEISEAQLMGQVLK